MWKCGSLPPLASRAAARYVSARKQEYGGFNILGIGGAIIGGRRSTAQIAVQESAFISLIQPDYELRPTPGRTDRLPAPYTIRSI